MLRGLLSGSSFYYDAMMGHSAMELANNHLQNAGQQAEGVWIRDIFKDAQKDFFVPRTPTLFLPDAWTRVFAEGLQKIAKEPGFERKSVLEVGVGTGITMAGLFQLSQTPARFSGVDLSKDAVVVSRQLARRLGLRKVAYLGQSDLLQQVPDRVIKKADHIIACIPQVPATVDLHARDNSAHYYAPTGSRWDQYGLGLNAALLEQARSRAPQAAITLNLAGRPGIGQLETLFKQYGRTIASVHAGVVRQHQETSLASLAQMEQKGAPPFEFFGDETTRKPLNAGQAEARRRDHLPLYHRIYTITADPVR